MADIVGDDKDSPKSELGDEKAIEKESSPTATTQEASTNNIDTSAAANAANDDSEYETLDEEDDVEEEGEGGQEQLQQLPSKLRSKESDDDDDVDEDSFASRRQFSNSSLEEDNLSDDIIIEEVRLEGDGQEEEERNKKLDDDEDRRNPQYIPKKGTFYEHDDRTCVESEENTANSTESGFDSKSNDLSANRSKNMDTGNRSNRSKQVWTDKASGDKWHHDLYVEDEQTPKTPRELIDIYGYDIRSEEAPPKARRRRKYGRGPKAYTRKWDDEPAYKANAGVMSSASRQPRTRNTYRRSFVEDPAEFPALNNKPDASKNRVQDQQQEFEQPTSTGSKGREVTYKSDEREAPSSHSKDAGEKFQPSKSILKTRQQNRSRSRPRPPTPTKEHVRFPPSKPVDAISLPKHTRGRGHFKPGLGPVPKLEFTPSRGRGRTSSAYSELLVRSGSDIGHITSDSHMKSVNTVIQNMGKIELTPSSGPALHDLKRTNIELHTNPVNMSHEKRVQEPSAANRSKRYSAQRQRSLPETTVTFSPVPVPAPAPPYYPPPTQPPPQTNPPEQYNPILGVPDYPPPPPPLPQQPLVQPPPPQMVAFAGPPPPFPPPPPAAFPIAAAAYPLPPAAAAARVIRPPPVQEMYQGQNGTVYYSPQSQAAIPRLTPSRRKKVAIPIVPPPEADMSQPPPAPPITLSSHSQC